MDRVARIPRSGVAGVTAAAAAVEADDIPVAEGEDDLPIVADAAEAEAEVTAGVDAAETEEEGGDEEDAAATTEGSVDEAKATAADTTMMTTPTPGLARSPRTRTAVSVSTKTSACRRMRNCKHSWKTARAMK